MDDHIELQGTVDRLLFHNTETGYAVVVVSLTQQQHTVACGYFPAVQAGENVILIGSWTTHPKFGKQFAVTQCTKQVPTSVQGLKKYLSSGLIKGIGPAYAERLINAFGTDVLDIIDKKPELLATVPGIGAARAQSITTAWKDQKEISQVMVFLQDKGISPTYAVKMYKHYGQETIALVTENPYRLAEDIWGIGFKMADQIAQHMGIALDSIKRVKAGILHSIGEATGNGHLYVELQGLKEAVMALLALDATQDHLLKRALHELHEEQKIKVISHEEIHYLTLTKYYFAEKGTAQKIQKLQAELSNFRIDLDSVYQALRTDAHGGITLNEDQQRGVLACLQHKITVITGGPGTGKTTLIKKLLAILDDQKLSYRLAAPTGRAAKRMNESTHKYAVTIHRLLEYDVMTRQFTKNESDALKLDFLIIDEASMLDIFLAHAILKAMPYTGHLVLIGDNDQLPSVGAGNVLGDLITSGVIPYIRLKEIFRQAQDSMIIVNAHRVNTGEFPTSQIPDAKKDFIFIKEQDPALAFDHIQSIYKQTLPRYGISTHDAMVLVPMNRGIVGTQKLNHDLQALLNTKQDEKKLSYHLYSYHPGDRVMQIRNNYDKAVFNGDMGIIDDINVSDRILHVRYDERVVEYESNELDELTLAYAISIHKSQGSEYPAVVIPIFMNHFTLLQRNLVYTAITRARKLCILIGQSKAIAIAIKNNKGNARITFLRQYLTSNLQCR